MHHPFRHEALPYVGTSAFVVAAVAMLRDALDRDERPLLLSDTRHLELVRDELGPDTDGVTLVATNEHGRNPSRLLTLMHTFLSAQAGRRTLVLAEPTLSTHSSAARLEMQLAESVLNAPAMHDWDMSVVCMYDSDTMNDDAVAEMRRSHPVVRGEPDDNSDFDVHRLTTLYGTVLPPPPNDATTLHVAGPQLAQVRELVHRTVLGYGVAPDRVDDLVLAVNEIVTNSIRHANGECTIRLWADGTSAVCEVADRGWLADPLVGRLAPDTTRANGRGLWLAHHLCDLVQIRSSRSGTVVRLYVDC